MLEKALSEDRKAGENGGGKRWKWTGKWGCNTSGENGKEEGQIFKTNKQKKSKQIKSIHPFTSRFYENVGFHATKSAFFLFVHKQSGREYMSLFPLGSYALA